MFDNLDPAVLLLQRMGSAARAEACAAAQRLDAVGRFVELRIAQDGGETDQWMVDATDAATLEISAALNVNRHLAASHVRYAHALRHQLPALGERFLAGDVDEAVFRAAVFRTGLIVDATVLAKVDRTLAERAPGWGGLSRTQLATRIDAIVARHDVDAVRRRKERLADRQVTWGDVDCGLTEITAVVFAPVARAFTERLMALAATVCDDDPRTLAQLRADAIGAVAAQNDRLSCHCDLDDCPAGGRVAGAVVVHVIAAQATLNGDATTGGILDGYEGLLPTELITKLARDARLRPLHHPGAAAPAECGYRPSRALADFVRCRDVTCRFPGCDRPGFGCDLDHTIPYAAGGPTHPSNLKCLCRFHHLAKTFWGWRDEQLPDGTVLWTSPAGECYPTSPGSGTLFPRLRESTGPVAPQVRTDDDRCADRTAMMPRRTRTRSHQRTADILTERHANHTHRTTPKPLHRFDEDYSYEETFLTEPEPPPF
ncbi:HNH endonuclease signature motif containing protein [Mycolicibacterium sp. GCM10028919]|uniref:HNH endonuclease signature motif containing protein n=1 Tax=Mycolicibacterium sp. GCM10028919 TaxID=3273401 RepID=UPI00361563BC